MLILLGWLSHQVIAISDVAPPRIKQLGPNAWLLTGSYFDEHMTVVETSAGLVVVDTLTTAAATERGLELLRQYTKEPVKFVINTHFNVDHYAGNQVFSDATIIGHVNCQKYFDNQVFEKQENAANVKNLIDSLPDIILGDDPESRSRRDTYHSWYSSLMEGFHGFEFTPPMQFIEENRTIHSGKTPIELRYFGPGHSDADLVVLFPEEKIMITGDLLLGQNSLPVIHRDGGGSISNLISILGRLQTLASRYTFVVPGHSTYTGLEVIRDQQSYLEELMQAVRSARESGLGLEQAKKSIPMVEYQDHWLYEFVHRVNIETAWHELENKKYPFQQRPN
jgi:glyoxylase-like metal-dependent hydrolase (beta-lactamase superfamily II)